MFRTSMFLTLLVLALHSGAAICQTLIRVNQIGYERNSVKKAVVLSRQNLSGAKVSVKDQDGVERFSGELVQNLGRHFNFSHSFNFDFSSLELPGEYVISIDSIISPHFKIGDGTYSAAVDSLLQFFRIQRCGIAKARYHSPCHQLDATSVQESPIRGGMDAVGGWHDAGDYSKFTITTAYTVYMLLLAWEYNDHLFPCYNRHRSDREAKKLCASFCFPRCDNARDERN